MYVLIIQIEPTVRSYQVTFRLMDLRSNREKGLYSDLPLMSSVTEADCMSDLSA